MDITQRYIHSTQVTAYNASYTHKTSVMRVTYKEYVALNLFQTICHITTMYMLAFTKYNQLIELV